MDVVKRMRYIPGGRGASPTWRAISRVGRSRGRQPRYLLCIANRGRTGMVTSVSLEKIDAAEAPESYQRESDAKVVQSKSMH